MLHLHASLLALLLSAQPAPQPNAGESAPRPAPAAEPVPAAPLPQGSVLYHTLTGREAQVVFTSDAPLEKIVGKSNAVAGFAVPGPDDKPAQLVAASWVLPVNSLATGIPLRDEHLAGDEWLDGARFPNITFTLSKVKDIKEIKRGDGFSTWSATLVGELSLKGVTRELAVEDARLSFFSESTKTAGIAPGNLIFIKCDYTIHLSDFGIQHSDVGGKVSNDVTLSQMLRLSSASPEAIQAAAQKGESPAKSSTQSAPPAKPQ